LGSSFGDNLEPVMHIEDDGHQGGAAENHGQRENPEPVRVMPFVKTPERAQHLLMD